jgi:diguanylate cyclase (GGDEF)-like protein
MNNSTYKQTTTLSQREGNLLLTVNRIASLLLQSRADALEENLSKSMALLGETVNVDRVYIWKNYTRDGELYCAQQYEWSNGAESQWGYELATETLYRDIIPRWEERLSRDLCINDLVRLTPKNEQEALSPQGIISILVVPIFLEDHFWGFVGFDDCHRERVFSENDEIILRSASEMIAGALSRAHLERKAYKIFYDPLTGIYNRRFFDDNIQHIIQTLSRAGDPLTLMMIDIDHFKRYNDIYGHVAGDSCIKAVAEALHGGLTMEDDFVARYGGEEFVVVMPNTDEKGAQLVAQRLLERVRECNIAHEGNPPANCVTVSIGVTTGRVEAAHSGNDIVQRADEQLYISKGAGRNRYTFSALI